LELKCDMDSSVGLVTRLRGTSLILGEGGDYSLFRNVHVHLAAHKIWFPLHTQGSFFRVNADRDAKLPDHFHLAPSLIMHVGFVPLML